MYKILIVEDETIIRKGLVYAIDYADLDCIIVQEAKNGSEGKSLIEKLRPDIIITDINMPIKNGLQMLEETYEIYDYSAIILSGYNEFEYAKKAISLNIVDYLLKPINHDDLKETIKKCIKQIEMKRLYTKATSNKESLLGVKLLPLNNKVSFYTQKTIEIIETSYMNKLQMSDCVQILKVSQTLINNKFKEDTGLTFNDYLNRYRINVAINLIKTKDMPIYKIAQETGFSDYTYFVKVFNKYTGVSPTEFRDII